ncbi:MAG: hypothetical protein RL266_999 [Bacteroidota bacterium]
MIGLKHNGPRNREARAGIYSGKEQGINPL